jgi:hypothetical protein
MAKLKIFILLVIILLSDVVVAQDCRNLLAGIEHETQQSEREWNLERKTANETGIMMLWKHGEEQILINIHMADSVKIARRWYKGTLPKSGGAAGSVTKLKGWGSEAVFVNDYLKQGNTTLIFRKDKIVVQTAGNSDDAVKQFARHILNQMAAI